VEGDAPEGVLLTCVDDDGAGTDVDSVATSVPSESRTLVRLVMLDPPVGSSGEYSKRGAQPAG
jgi:hypothetical protein